MKRLVVLLIALILLIAAYVLYRYSSTERLDVTPDAQREIEKAKQR
jgi:Tfp pilus assembly protein PilO